MGLLIKTKIKKFAGFLVFSLGVIISGQALAINFTVTGYYSPLPKQEFYLTGDYLSEIRLNGKGLAGADGTEVYHGMIAAPRNYKFGTKICLNTLGCGTVHDRGGAIVNKGERNKAVHDRIDYWMGYGTDGLERSLDWGVRSVGGSFSHGSARKRSLVERRKEMSPILLEVLRQKKEKELFNKNLYPGASNIDVKKLKEALDFLKFFRGNLDTTKYDDIVRKSVLNFQLKYKVIDNESSIGAGNFGPKTREKMEEVIRTEVDKYLRNKWKTNVFQENLSYDDHDMDVFRLQQILLDKGLLDATPTGYFGKKTEKAVENFQIQNGLISSKNSQGAGNFGPKTREKMKELWIARRDSFFPNTNAPIIQVVKKEENKVEENLVAQAGVRLDFFKPVNVGNTKFQFANDVILFRGKRNENVRQLQKELKKMGFFAGNTTGFYGDETAEAVLAFQFKNKIVSSRRSVGAAIFGPTTRLRMNNILRAS